MVKQKFKPTVHKIKLEPEQAVLWCSCSTVLIRKTVRFQGTGRGMYDYNFRRQGTKICNVARGIDYMQTAGRRVYDIISGSALS